MITIASILLFLAFYTAYYTSKRVPLSYNFGFEKWMQKNKKQARIISLFLFAIAYILWINATAFGTGTLQFIIELMAIGSLIVILKPLKIINSKFIFFVFITIGLLEIYYA